MVNIPRYLRTVRYLKKKQGFYQLYYRCRAKWRQWRSFNPPVQPYKKPVKLQVNFPFLGQKSYLGENSFSFLNQKKTFVSGVNWNYMGYGKLWNYNLLYFDYLNQPNIGTKEKVRFIRQFLDNFERIKFARDPYPVSLRCINWIKFLIQNEIVDLEIEHAVYKQYYLLADSIEYHLLGNHLLENGCSLLTGGIYFDDKKLWLKGRQILMNQLDEQILGDGGHFERSPMYHQLILYRLLDCYNMIMAWAEKENNFGKFLKNKIEKMLGWLNEITFKTGAIPHVNDTANDIAPTTAQLSKYAREMALQISDITLNESGYRIIKKENYEWLIDVGDIGPDYIPGHAHSDTFSFTLNVHNKPIVVDTGVSTYEECVRRTVERATGAHNTVIVNEEEQTEVWKAFRVGRRAHISKLEEEPGSISAEHDGYKHMGMTHRRTFEWYAAELLIKDRVFGRKDKRCTAFIHFHPEVNIDQNKEIIFIDDFKIAFSGHTDLQIESYKYAEGFNRLEPATMLKINFRDTLDTRIIL